jgi:hypothetical protein
MIHLLLDAGADAMAFENSNRTVLPEASVTCSRATVQQVIEALTKCGRLLVRRTVMFLRPLLVVGRYATVFMGMSLWSKCSLIMAQMLQLRIATASQSWRHKLGPQLDYSPIS